MIGDLERIISKVAVGRVSPREVVQLKVALQAIEPIKEACLEADNASLNRIGEQLNLCIPIRDRIAKEINNDPPLLINKGGVIKDGVNADLDELRQISYSGKDYLLKIQQRESESTGIPSLKVAYNNVFGYYIEVRNVHKDKVPKEWIRKQSWLMRSDISHRNSRNTKRKFWVPKTRFLCWRPNYIRIWFRH